MHVWWLLQINSKSWFNILPLKEIPGGYKKLYTRLCDRDPYSWHYGEIMLIFVQNNVDKETLARIDAQPF